MTASTTFSRPRHFHLRGVPTWHPSDTESGPDLKVMVLGGAITPVGMPRLAGLPPLHRGRDGTTTAFEPVALTDLARAKLPPVDAVLLLAGAEHDATIATLGLIQRRLDDTPVVVLDREHSSRAARETLVCGAVGYLAGDDIDPATVVRAVHCAIERRSTHTRRPHEERALRQAVLS